MLATAASRVVFQQEIAPDPALTNGPGRPHPTTVNAVTTDTTATPTVDPEPFPCAAPRN